MSDAQAGRNWQADFEKVSAENRGKKQKIRKLVKVLREQREQLKGVEALQQQVDDWKAKAEASHPELKRRIGELEGTIRQGKHREAFNKAAAGKLHPDALDAAWQLSGYKAEADEVTPETFAPVLERVATEHPRLALPAGGEQKGVEPTREFRPVTDAGGGRGTPAAGGRTFDVPLDKMSDPKWVEDNWAEIKAAKKAGTYRLV